MGCKLKFIYFLPFPVPWDIELNSTKTTNSLLLYFIGDIIDTKYDATIKVFRSAIATESLFRHQKPYRKTGLQSQ